MEKMSILFISKHSLKIAPPISPVMYSDIIRFSLAKRFHYSLKNPHLNPMNNE